MQHSCRPTLGLRCPGLLQTLLEKLLHERAAKRAALCRMCDIAHYSSLVVLVRRVTLWKFAVFVAASDLWHCDCFSLVCSR